MKPFAPLALAAILAASASAQTTFTDPANLRGERVAPRTGRELPIDQGASGLQQLLRKLNTRGSLMLIVAHPDDEDGGMLTFYSRGLGARVATLTLNRGEGGQNFVTPDFEDALGHTRRGIVQQDRSNPPVRQQLDDAFGVFFGLGVHGAIHRGQIRFVFTI